VADRPVQPDLWDGRKSVEVRYLEWRFTEDGREVAHQVEQLALTAAAAGHKRISVNLLFEQLRQVRRIPIDNSFRAFLAREIRDRHPELRDRIHIRTKAA